MPTDNGETPRARGLSPVTGKPMFFDADGNRVAGPDEPVLESVLDQLPDAFPGSRWEETP
jgi:hypothetical protein